MADETIIIDIEYNTDEAEQQIDSLTSSIEGLKVQQADLRKQLQDGTISQTEYSKEMAKISVQLQRENKQRKDAIRLQQAEAGSREQLRQKITQLTRARNELNTETEEGRQRSEELRQEIEELTEVLSDSATQTERNRMNIGNYEEAINNALPGVGGFISGMKDMIKSSLAFIATPIGAAITAVVAALALLQKAYGRSEERMAKVQAVTGKLSGVFNGLLKALEPVVDFLIDYVIFYFDTLGKVVNKTVGLVAKALDKLGFEKAAEKLEEYTEKVQEAAKAGEELSNAQFELNKQMRESERIQLNFQKLAEKQRQIRDDESRSIEERIQANEKLGQLLQQQLREELRIAQKALDVAEMRVDLEGETTDNLDARAEALVAIEEIQERITGQESEQLVNINSLRREELDLLEQKAIKLQEEAQAELEAKFELDQMLLEEEIAFQDELNNAKIGAEEELKNDLLNGQMAFEKAVRNEQNKTAEERKQLLMQGLDTVKQLTSETSQFLLDNNKFRLNKELQQLQKQKDNELISEVRFGREKRKLERDFAKKQKRISITNAVINGALSITKAFAELGPIAGAIAAVLIGTVTGFQIAKIRQQQFKKGGRLPLARNGAKFGTFSGPGHSSGGIPIINGLTGRPLAEVEGGENFYVVNKKASSYINSLSDINQRIGGGVPLSNSRKTMQDGGQADLNNGGTDINMVTKEVLNNLPPIVVQTVDIKTGLESRDEVLNVGVV